MSEILDRYCNRPVIIGGGIAGLVTALCLAPMPVLLLSRDALGHGASSMLGQGGLAAALGPGDDAKQHLADTLAAGDGLCDAGVAEGILCDAPAAIALLEAFDVPFDRTAEGAFSLGLEAAHGQRRILHAGGDRTGAGIMQALIEAVAGTPSITIMDSVTVERLIADDGALQGLLCRRKEDRFRLATRQAVLATGGLGDLYEASTNPDGNFGQGIALAARAGVRLADLEFVQFHPTALASDRRPLALISEAVRGEGAVLVNERGDRIMRAIPGAELAPRDVVARAIAGEIARGSRVFLDARTALGSGFAIRFPGISALCAEEGLDPAVDLLPVRPAAHYHMGGIASDETGRSSLPGLWAIGEIGATGLHGANRLASNSLLEAVVMGMRAASDLAGQVQEQPGQRIGSEPLPPTVPDLAFIRPLASRHLAVLRSGSGLQEALDALLPLIDRDDAALVAALIAAFALNRRESRGAHMRLDHPAKLPGPARRQILTGAQALALAASNNQSSYSRSA